MSDPNTAPGKKPLAGIALLYFCMFFAAWVGAWVLYLRLKGMGVLPETDFAHFLYWTAARVLLWVLTSLALLRLSGKRFRDALCPQGIKPALIWGGGAGILIGIVSVLTRVATHQPFLTITWGWPLLTVVIIAPVVEEVTFRGALMGALESRFSFAVSNLISGVLFLLIHFPGWFFSGVLPQNLRNPVGGALAILLLGWVFGYVAHRSKSLTGSILAHVLNNLFSL
jgi:membrane protease YdiL (CAAX protease family)